MVDELHRLEEFRDTIRGELREKTADPNVRRVAATVYLRLICLWGLSVHEAATLLAISENEYGDWLRGEFNGVDAGHLEKISCLMGIYKSLFTLYSGHTDRVDAWLRKRNDDDIYAGKTPYDTLAGESAIVFHLVRRNVAAWTVW